MAITKLSTNGIYGDKYGDIAANNNNWYEAIQTVLLSSTQATVEFTNIPTDYQHLQIRCFARGNRATYGTGTLAMRINNVSTASYSFHFLLGDGASVASSPGSNVTAMDLGNNSIGSTVSNSFGGVIIDVLDYKDTNKFKTVRALGGVDINGTIAGYGGHVSLGSGMFQNTNAVSSIQLLGTGSSFSLTQYSRFSLYGLRA